MNGTKKRLSDDRQPRCIACRRMLYLTPEGECQNCRHLAAIAERRERGRNSDMALRWRKPDEGDDPAL